jgi:hypothetical protein
LGGPIVGSLARTAPPTTASESNAATCDDCVFRQLLLCAIPGNAPCPTFRPAATTDLLTPPQPPQRHLSAVAAA